MVEYPISTLVDAGVDEVILVVGGRNPGAFLELFKNGHSHGLKRLYYAYQEGEGGIADALKLAEPFIDPGEDCVVILGDNYFEDSLKFFVDQWNKRNTKSPQASILLKQVVDPERFGVAEILSSTGEISSIKEKPDVPKSDLAIIGCYIFDYVVWSWIETLKVSARGELEITDLLTKYLHQGSLSYSVYPGYWSDLGTFQTWMEVSQKIMNK